MNMKGMTKEQAILNTKEFDYSMLQEEYTRKEYGDLADIIILHDQMVDSGELEKHYFGKVE